MRGRSTPVRPTTCARRARVRAASSRSYPPRPTICCLTRAMISPSSLTVGDRAYSIYRLAELQSEFDVERLPYTLRILLEDVLRLGDDDGVRAIATWDARAEPSNEISFAPGRVLL